MERIIKFRGKCDEPDMPYHGIWAYGCLKIAITETGKKLYYIVEISVRGGIYHVDPATIGQFTGLKDSEGNKIWEGDILRHPSSELWNDTNFICYEVFWQSADFRKLDDGWRTKKHFVGAIGGGEYPTMTNETTKRMKIIGNIHNNPELLKEAQNG